MSHGGLRQPSDWRVGIWDVALAGGWDPVQPTGGCGTGLGLGAEVWSWLRLAPLWEWPSWERHGVTCPGLGQALGLFPCP